MNLGSFDYRITKQLTEVVGCAKVDAAATQHLRQLSLYLCKPEETRNTLRLEFDQQVYVAVGACMAARMRLCSRLRARSMIIFMFEPLTPRRAQVWA